MSARPVCALGERSGSREATALPAFRNRALAAIRGSAPDDFRDQRRSCLTSRPWKCHSMKPIFVQFGVNVGGLKEAVSEHVSHLLKAGSTPDHACRGCMPANMRALHADRDSGQFEMAFRDATDRTATSNRAERRAGA